MESNLQYIQFNEIGVTFAVIVAAMSFVVLSWNAVKAILDWRAMAKKPADDKMADHERRITALEASYKEAAEKLQSDWEFQQDEVEFNKLMLKSIKQLIKHGIDGNNTGGLEEMEKEIDEYLVDHKN